MKRGLYEEIYEVNLPETVIKTQIKFSTV